MNHLTHVTGRCGSQRGRRGQTADVRHETTTFRRFVASFGILIKAFNTASAPHLSRRPFPSGRLSLHTPRLCTHIASQLNRTIGPCLSAPKKDDPEERSEESESPGDEIDHEYEARMMKALEDLKKATETVKESTENETDEAEEEPAEDSEIDHEYEARMLAALEDLNKKSDEVKASAENPEPAIDHESQMMTQLEALEAAINIDLNTADGGDEPDAPCVLPMPELPEHYQDIDVLRCIRSQIPKLQTVWNETFLPDPREWEGVTMGGFYNQQPGQDWSVRALDFEAMGGWGDVDAVPWGLFAKLRLLQNLNLDSCGVTSIGDEIGECTNLEELILDYNDSLHSLPATIGNLQKLEKLTLKSCEKIGALPEALGDLPALEHLDITGCALLSVPFALGRLKLKVLKMGNNPFLDAEDAEVPLEWGPGGALESNGCVMWR